MAYINILQLLHVTDESGFRAIGNVVNETVLPFFTLLISPY